MSLTFPLDRAAFVGRLSIRDRSFLLSESLEFGETNGGHLFEADKGPRLWRGHFQLRNKTTLREAERMQGLVELLQYSSRGFMAFDPVLPGPAFDPDGVLIAGSSPEVLSVSADNKGLRLSGLPAGYTLSDTDKLTVVSASGAVGLHRVVGDPVVAAANGETGVVQVVPHVLPGFAAADPVTLFQPYCKARIVPGSFNPGKAKGLFVEGFRFEFVQDVK
jgi:hypothetical protein